MLPTGPPFALAALRIALSLELLPVLPLLLGMWVAGLVQFAQES